ncbi:putative trans-sialidase, Group V [Trypanosoma cruzi]|nr:putative trans-sialidase, Group V [Trypanosoma cruzi]
MLSRVAAVKAPRTQNRRRVTGSRGRRREGGESERQRRNMSRHLFCSAVLLLVLVMVCCGTGGAAQDPEQASEPKFEWKEVKDEDGDVTVESLGAPGLLKVGSDVFAVAEVQCKDSQNTVFTGIASQLLTKTADKEPMEEVLKDAKEKTQVLEEGGSEDPKKRVDVSRPTAVVKGSDIYMLVGKYNGEGDAACQGEDGCGLFLLKGGVTGEGSSTKIGWTDTKRLPKNIFGEQLKSLTGLIGGGGSGVKITDDTLVLPVEGTKNGKAVSLIIYSSDTNSWTLSKGMSADGCGVPSVVEWGEKDKLMMMTVCDDGRRRVYESGDKGESWTEALGTLSRVWGNKHEGNVKGVRSGFSTATIGDGVDDNNKKNVMLVTLPVYLKEAHEENEEKENEKGVLHLWLTDNTHIVDIGPVSGDDDAAASSLLYRSGNNNEELIALYEKKKGDGKKPSPGMVSVRLTEQLQRVKEVLTTWKEVDERVSKLCPSENAKNDAPTATACSNTVKITDGLVGFLSGNFSGTTWKDEYLGVNATVTKEEGATVATENRDGVRFTGRGAWAEWPVGKQGDNQLYHFANYNFTLVATVSIDNLPEEGDTHTPLMGAKLNGDNNPVLVGLSYNNKEKKWILLCGGGENKKYISDWETKKSEHVVILLRNGNQGSVYVDGQRVGGDEQCKLGNKDSKGISHFYIGGSAENTETKEDVSVTVSNVLLYNRPLSSEEINTLNPNKAPIPPLVEVPTKPLTVSSASVVSPFPSVAAAAQIAGTSSTPAGTQQTEREQPMGSSGAGSGGASTSAGKDSVKQVASGKTSDGAQTVDGGSTADGEPTMEKREGTDAQKEEVHPQVREVNATALNSSLGHLSQGNNTDAGTVRGSGLLSLLLLLGLWVFAAL